jgi:hypothetical protein
LQRMRANIYACTETADHPDGYCEAHSGWRMCDNDCDVLYDARGDGCCPGPHARCARQRVMCARQRAGAEASRASAARLAEKRRLERRADHTCAAAAR